MHQPIEVIFDKNSCEIKKLKFCHPLVCDFGPYHGIYKHSTLKLAGSLREN